MNILKVFKNFAGDKFIIRITKKNKYQVLPERYNYADMCAAQNFNTRADAIASINQKPDEQKLKLQNRQKKYWNSYVALLRRPNFRQMRLEINEKYSDARRCERLYDNKIRYNSCFKSVSDAEYSLNNSTDEYNSLVLQYELLLRETAKKINIPIELFRYNSEIDSKFFK